MYKIVYQKNIQTGLIKINDIIISLMLFAKICRNLIHSFAQCSLNLFKINIKINQFQILKH